MEGLPTAWASGTIGVPQFYFHWVADTTRLRLVVQSMEPSKIADELLIPEGGKHAYQEMLRQARITLGPQATQYWVAEQAGVSQSFVSSQENGPAAGTRFLDLWRLLRYYGIPIQRAVEVLGLEGKRDYAEEAKRQRVEGLMRGLYKLPEEDLKRVEWLIETVTKGIRSQ